MKTLPVIAAACATCAMASTALAQSPVLTVYTYDSFVSDWGPGPAIEAGFEERCGCDLRLVGAGDGAALLGRLRLEGAQSPADVVLGLDTNLMQAAAQTGLLAPHGLDLPPLDLPVDWADDTFVPYDWGYFAFVYDTTRLPAPPTSLAALAEAPEDLRIVIQDPRSSTPGLGLVMWVKAAHGARAGEIWQGLAPRILTVTPGWSEAYGLFLDGEADMVLSYTTSPAYHLIAEGDATKAAAPFEEGHYMQVELAARLAGAREPGLAQDFLAYLLSDAAQSVLPTTNWMYPARVPEGGLPEGFETLITPTRALLFSAEEAARLREAAIEEWRAALAR